MGSDTIITRADGTIICTATGGYAPVWEDGETYYYQGRTWWSAERWARAPGGDGGFPNGIRGTDGVRSYTDGGSWYWGGSGAPSLYPTAAWSGAAGYGDNGYPAIGYGSGGGGSSFWDRRPKGGRWWGATGNTGYVEIETVKRSISCNSPDVAVVIKGKSLSDGNGPIDVEVPKGATKCKAVYVISGGSPGTFTEKEITKNTAWDITLTAGHSGGYYKDTVVDVIGKELLTITVGKFKEDTRVVRKSDMSNLFLAKCGTATTLPAPAYIAGQTGTWRVTSSGAANSTALQLTFGATGPRSYVGVCPNWSLSDDRDAGQGGGAYFYKKYVSANNFVSTLTDVTAGYPGYVYLLFS